MSKALRFFIIVMCVCLQACHKTSQSEATVANAKVDLGKAASYNVQLGMGYLKQGDRPRAKKKLLAALEQEPHSPDVNAAIAYYFEKTNELEQAKKYYLKAISYSSNSGAQLNNYGAFLCRQGHYKQAENHFLNAVKDQQYIHTAGAYENAGLCALERSDDNKAKQYFTAALNQDPSKRVSLYELIKLESKKGHNDNALVLLQKNPELVLNDKIFLALAKDIATKAGKNKVATEYENSYKKLESVGS